MIRFLLYILGFLLMVIGFTSLLIYLNFEFTIPQYISFISKRVECYLPIIGLILIIITSTIKKSGYNL